jgi:eukaryotic-like serine/threonine-protein kinase
MALTVGALLGPYEIVAPLGAGGMGEVYKARDTRLDRAVAIKILPEALAADSQFRERFHREARAISQLDHPHICTLYDVGEERGMAFLVMQYLEGVTLADRLVRGPLSPAEALPLAIQIANALDKAHRAGIIHRDLKPGNIMLTRTGAKLLDFGLAKASGQAAAGALSMLATTPPNLTAQGTILGTFQYMAPEQLEGKETDARTDIFAFGAVVYEMLTGKKAFEGKSQASLIAAILDHDPPSISSVHPLTPPQLDHVVKRCLAKSPEDRWQTASDLAQELKWAEDKRSDAAAIEPRRSRVLPLGLAALAAAVIALVVGFAVWMLKPTTSPTTPAVVRLAVTLPAGEQVAAGYPMALSSDGGQLVYIAKNQLHLRPLNSLASKALAGTEGAQSPFFSPDGQWIGFFAQNKLKRISISGGVPQALTDAPQDMGGSWGPDETIYYASGPSSPIWQIPAAGGSPLQVTTLDRSKGEVSHRWPQVLPGGKALLFTTWTGPGWDERHLHLQVLGTGERRVLIQGASTGRYLSSGRLVYSRAGALMTTLFDLARLNVSAAPPTPLELQVREVSQGAEFAVSDNGVLAYISGNPQGYVSRLVIVDRKGTMEPLAAPPQPYNDPGISPDGQRAVVTIRAGTLGLWVYDFSRATLTALTTNGSAQDPVWTPDGKRIAFRQTLSGYRNLYWKPADGSGDEERLTTSENLQTAVSFAPDGKWLAFWEADPTTNADIWLLPLSGDRKPQVFLKTRFAEYNPQFAPDGQWLAYVSNESGREEIHVRRFPDSGAKWQISTDSGYAPVWSRDGQELFYRSADKTMVVDVRTRPAFGSPRVLFEARYPRSTTGVSGYDVFPDGRRFLRPQQLEPEQAATQVNVVINWFEDVKRRASAK